MAVPNVVKRKAEAALKMAQAQSEQRQPTQQTQVPPVVTNNQEAPLNDGVVEQQVLEQEPGLESSEPVPTGMTTSQDDFETRYKNLRKSRNDRATQAEQRAAKLERELEEARAANAPAPTANQLTEEQIAEMSPTEKALYDRVQTLESDKVVEQEMTQAQKEEIFFSDVASIVPDWETINGDPKFMEWLKAPDGSTGRTRQESLAKARAVLNSEVVSNLFGSYANEVQYASGGDNGAVVSNNANLGVVETGRGSATATAAVTGEPGVVILSNADVKAFYDEKQRTLRRKQMTPEKKAAFDAREIEIRKAHAEGRIR